MLRTKSLLPQNTSAPRLCARRAAISRSSALRSNAVTFPCSPTRAARLIAGSPVPLARSSQPLHSTCRSRLFHQRIRDRLAHGRRLGLPLLGGDEAIPRTQSRLGVWLRCHRELSEFRGKISRLSFSSSFLLRRPIWSRPDESRTAWPPCAGQLSCARRSSNRRLPAVWPSSTAVPDRRTSAPSPRKRGQRSPHNPATPTPPACSLRRAPAADLRPSGAVPPRRQLPAPAADWSRCKAQNSR